MSKKKLTELVVAVLEGDDQALERLLIENGVPEGALSALQKPLAENDLPHGVRRVVEELLGKDAVTEGMLSSIKSIYTASLRRSPLLGAINDSNVKLVDLLLHHGADPNLRVRHQGTPLIKAAGIGNVEIIELLLAAGADVNLPADDTATAHTPLTQAAYRGHLEVVRRLLEAGADPRAPGTTGDRPLDHAKVGKRERSEKPWGEIISTLREALADGPPDLCLEELTGEPEVLAELRLVEPALAAVTWRRAAFADLELFESAPLTDGLVDWDKLQEIAQRHGFAPVLVAWSLDSLEPSIAELEEGLKAVSTGADAAMQRVDRRWRRYTTRKELAIYRSGPIELVRDYLQLKMRGQHMVLLRGPAALVAVVYRYAQCDWSPEELGAILMTWYDRIGAELAGIDDGATIKIVLPQPLTDEQEIRRCALEIHGVTHFHDPLEALITAASRQWTLWWEG
jgi:hypothetical protein